MTRIRPALVLLALLALTLPFIMGAAAASDAEEGVGDASAGLVGATLEVEDLDGLTSGILGGLVGQLSGLDALDTSLLDALDTHIDLGLLEGLTVATTRSDAPDAAALLSPLRIGDDRPHDISAEPGERHTGSAVAPAPLSELVSGLGLSAFGVSADADDDSAIAMIEAVDATVDALGVTGFDVGLTGVVSEVTRTGATAEQDLMVDGLAIGLGDILPADLLESLPIEDLLGLIEGLGDAGLLDVGDLSGALEDTLADVTSGIADLNGFDPDDIGDVDAETLADLEELLDLLGDLEDIGDLEDLFGDLLDGLDGATGGIIGGLLPGLTDQVDDLEDLLGVLEGADAIDDCVDGLPDIGDIGDIDEAQLNAIETCVNSVLDQLDIMIEALLGDILDQLGLGGLLETLQSLRDDLLSLGGLLDTIRGLIDDITGLDLLTADSLGLEVLAAADAEGGSTTITCELGGLAILGDALGDQSCEDGSLGGGVGGAVDDALGVLGDVLESLPGVSGVGDLRLDLLPVATEEVTTDEGDGTVTARAHAVLLELVVPSVTIDPSDALELPSLNDIAGLVGLIDALLSQTGIQDLLEDAGLGGLVGAELDMLTGELGTLIDDLDETLGTVLDLLGDIDLDLDVLGISIRTPAINLVLDPVSEATFTPAADDSQVMDPGDDPGDDPVPGGDDPAGAPDLPRTGGGIALLGLLAMFSAAGLRRMTG